MTQWGAGSSRHVKGGQIVYSRIYRRSEQFTHGLLTQRHMDNGLRAHLRFLVPSGTSERAAFKISRRGTPWIRHAPIASQLHPLLPLSETILQKRAGRRSRTWVIDIFAAERSLWSSFPRHSAEKMVSFPMYAKSRPRIENSREKYSTYRRWDIAQI